MVKWIKNLRKRCSGYNSRARLLIMVTILLFFAGTGWGVINIAAKQVTIKVDDKQIYTRTFCDNVAGLLQKQHIILGEKDTVVPALESPITRNMTIEVLRAIPVKIVADGTEKEFLASPRSKVADVLTKAGITLGSEDRVTPDLYSIIAPGERIKVTRVTTKIETVKNEIDYRVERRADNKIEKGITYVIQKGRKGIQEENYRVVYADGQEVSRELLTTKLIKEPVPQVIAVGALNTVSRGGQVFNFRRAIIATATAYTHTGNPTATGVYPKVGTIAVDPNVIPLGSKLYVEGYGFGVAQDVGSAIKGNRIDVFLDSHAATVRWGIRKVKVYVLE